LPARHLLLVATFLLSMLLYVDRICISTAKGPVSADLDLTDRPMGWVFSAFSLGYALFDSPGMRSHRAPISGVAARRAGRPEMVVRSRHTPGLLNLLQIGSKPLEQKEFAPVEANEGVTNHLGRLLWNANSGPDSIAS
jgi:MFS family permease